MRLDIGCADRPKGDVNIDLFRVTDESGYETRGLVKTRPDIIAEATCLPFCDTCFDEIVCHDVIEHTFFPQRLLSEIVRVLEDGGRADVRCPHRFGVGAKKPCHRQYFKPSWFSAELSKLVCSFRVNTQPRSFFPFLPNEIRVEIWKRHVMTFGEYFLRMEHEARKLKKYEHSIGGDVCGK